MCGDGLGEFGDPGGDGGLDRRDAVPLDEFQRGRERGGRHRAEIGDRPSPRVSRRRVFRAVEETDVLDARPAGEDRFQGLQRAVGQCRETGRPARAQPFLTARHHHVGRVPVHRGHAERLDGVHDQQPVRSDRLAQCREVGAESGTEVDGADGQGDDVVGQGGTDQFGVTPPPVAGSSQRGVARPSSAVRRHG